MIQQLRNFLTPERRRIIGAEAQQALDNKHWKEAFVAVNEYLDQVALSCDPDNKDKAQRIVLSKQLLATIKQELIRKIEDGEVAKVEIEQIEARNRPRLFTRHG
jgi:tellurite resistance protein